MAEEMIRNDHFRFRHLPDMRTGLADVCLLGETGSHRRAVMVTRLTQPGNVDLEASKIQSADQRADRKHY